MLKIGIIFISVTLFLTGCEDPAQGKAKAVTADANPKAVTIVQSRGETLAFSGENSQVGFTGSKVTGKHDGGFSRFSGTIDLVNANPEESQVAVEIETGSVYTDADGLTKHLQTGDFFEVEKYPKASFVSTRIVADAAGGDGNYAVTGDLELRGVKKSVTFPARILISPTEVTVDSEFSINRKDFNILYAGKADDLIRDDVVLRLSIKAPRKN